MTGVYAPTVDAGHQHRWDSWHRHINHTAQHLPAGCELAVWEAGDRLRDAALDLAALGVLPGGIADLARFAAVEHVRSGRVVDHTHPFVD